MPTPRESNPLIDELGLREKFVVMYSGNAGTVHDFDGICDAMLLLKDDPRIHFLFVGNGPRRTQVEDFVRVHRISNFEYRDYFSREQLRYSLSVGDVHLISLRAAFVGISVPGKLYGIMASGRPALFVGPKECESAESIVDAGCGVVIDPAEGSAGERLARAIQDCSTNSAQTKAYGDAGRVAFERRYEQQVNCEAFAQVLMTHWRSRWHLAAPDVTAEQRDAVLLDA